MIGYPAQPLAIGSKLLRGTIVIHLHAPEMHSRAVRFRQARVSHPGKDLLRPAFGPDAALVNAENTPGILARLGKGVPIHGHRNMLPLGFGPLQFSGQHPEMIHGGRSQLQGVTHLPGP